MKSFAIVTLLIAAAPSWAAEIYNFSLLPANGQIQGTPGTAIGWGYMLENQSSDYWLVPTGLSNNSFEFGTPLNVFDFPILAPGASVTVPFNSTNLTGLFALTWDSNAPLGTVESGVFVLGAEWWTGDPFGTGQLGAIASPTTRSYSAAVVTPEPATGALVAMAVLGKFLLRRRQTKR